MIHFSHIPLFYLRQEFPEAYEKIVRYRTFALCRDPHDRFASATFQRMEEFKGIPPLQITSDVALAEAREVIDWLAPRERFCDLEYIHFTRQSDYVQLDGAQLVGEVFRLEDMDAFGRALGGCFGVEFDPERRENTNAASLNSVFTAIRPLKPIYSRLTSWKFREGLLHLMQRWKLRSPASLYARFREDEAIRAFVEAYYAADFALRRTAEVRAAAGPALAVATAG